MTLTAFMRNLKKSQGGILMIDIHITDKGIEPHIENVKAIELA